MIYVALLRGINVGGKNKVSMAQLKTAFEAIGLKNVKTYINSGNVIFTDEQHTDEQLVALIEKAILKEFDFTVYVIVRTIDEMKETVAAIPIQWRDTSIMKCDVLFLWKEIDSKDVLTQIVIKPEIDQVKYIDGAVVFAIDRNFITRSGLPRIVGTPIYKKITIRNCNTTCKLLELMNEVDETQEK